VQLLENELDKNKKLAEDTVNELKETEPESSLIHELHLERKLWKRLTKERNELKKSYIHSKEMKKARRSGHKKKLDEYKLEVIRED